MMHYVYVFLAENSDIYSPIRVNCTHTVLMGYGELYPGHVKVFSTGLEKNTLSIETTKKNVDLEFELPEEEMDVGYLITHVSGKITIRQVDPCEMLNEDKLVRIPACKMEKVPLYKTSESPAEKQETMTISVGWGINCIAFILAYFYTAFMGIDF